ncbi:MFS transporter [Halobacillus sp. Marseille-Q1614]|uniref:MFS transporter n=1 Tax=Halobacillus sp. Marseille-Q1614 TaxID=2709134 RepID=UPI0020C27900|nr:MFS transporter [Halobacillus sp. Marseille-Q1614]
MSRKNVNIRYYLMAGSVSRLGDVLSGMAFLFLAYDLTQSALHTTAMAMAEALPYLFFGLIGGVIADWLPKKKLLLFLDIIRIPLISSVVVFHYLDILTFVYLIIVSFLIQSIGCFFNPAHRSVLPLITNEDERTKINSLYDSLTRGVTVISPFLTVWLLNSHGAIHFFTVDALTYGISALCIWWMNINESRTAASRSIKAVFGAVAEFLRWLKGESVIRKLFLFTFLTVFFNTWVWEVGLLLALTEMSSNSEEIYSILQSVFGGVVILTNLILPYFIKKMTLKMYVTGTIIWGVGITYYGLLYNLPHFFIGCSIVGVGLPIAGLSRVYLLQTLVPEAKMGRAFSTNALLLYFSNTISLAFYGTLAVFIPIQYLMIGSGLVIVIISVTGMVILSVTAAKLGRRSPVNLFK